MNFFKKEASLDIINNKFGDLCNLDLSKFDDSSFTEKGKVFKDFLNENNISTKNLLILSTKVITFLFGKKFLYDESGSIIEERKEILCKILGNEELTKAFSDVEETTLKDGLLSCFPELFAEIIYDEKALDIIRALSYPEINNPVFWTSVYGIYSHVKKENKGYVFVTFLKTLLFGKYDGPPLKVKTELVFYNKEGEKIKKDEGEFNFGKDPVENIKEIFKGVKKESGVDDIMPLLEDLFRAYASQENNNISNNIINTNSNLIGNQLQL